ncbi:MAG: Glu/Leu/Phe/Val dehydrogenase [Bacteroidota bacterium]|nr:Glu/Leu/Phe/Val dehydrogenase [Bacteroidota bacterium]
MSQSNATISETQFDVFSKVARYDHEQILICQDNHTGLKAIIAIHNTVLGPGLGGTRMWNYATEEEAINDALRLSRGMTYKAAISGLNLGGAKAVIIGDPKKHKSEQLMRKFGRFVENLGGKYITAEDVGTTTKDMEYVAMETEHVVGLPEIMGGGGDPSPVTAYGVYMGIKASAKKAYGSDNLNGKKIAVQGTGKVGLHLIEMLKNDGAILFATDIFEHGLKIAADKYGASIVKPEEIFGLDVDIFAPCALGAILNTNNINQLKCQIVAGAANNQLEDDNIHGDMIKAKGIFYAPDFLINAGGLINVYSEYNGYVKEIAFSQTENIYNTVLDIYNTADEFNINTQLAAIKLAEKRVNDTMHLQSRI